MQEQQAQWEWTPEQKIEITGLEFGMYKALVEAVVSSPESQKAYLAAECMKMLNTKIQEGISEGWIKKQEPIIPIEE